MTKSRKLRAVAGSFTNDQDGTALVEFAIVLPLFLLMFFALLDFGRLGFEYVTAEKAVDYAARIAATRPAACANVPNFNIRLGSSTARYGTNCAAGGAICVNPGAITCVGNPTNPTVAEIWGRVANLMPSGSTAASLTFTYSYDANLGFVGGPYVPVVTVEMPSHSFQFVTPLGQLAALAGATGTTPGSGLTFPTLSVSLPGEDLAAGTNG